MWFKVSVYTVEIFIPISPTYSKSIIVNPILLIAAVVVAWLVFTWLLRVAKTTLKTALLIALIVLGLQVIVGIGPDQVLQTIVDLPRIVQDLFNSQSSAP